MNTILLLGGTADARQLTSRLHYYFSQSNGKNKPRIIYSVAGLVRTPDVPCEVLVGGFSAIGGLACYVKQQAVDMIVDVTHPYAEKMTSTAMHVAEKTNIYYMRFHRTQWQAMEGDQWITAQRWPDVLTAVKSFSSLFLTAGQLTQDQVNHLHQQNKQQRQLLRTAVKPKIVLPPSMVWIKAIGPFNTDAEHEIFQQYSIDCLVSKNSGGDATAAKLHVARECRVPVVMLARPPAEAFNTVKHKRFDNIDACEQAILNQVQHDESTN
ncbi:precorrin-6A/cobalt-precorrin-6A reductase [Eionea flava]